MLNSNKEILRKSEIIKDEIPSRNISPIKEIPEERINFCPWCGVKLTIHTQKMCEGCNMKID